MQANY